jgi:hypothetical protein
MRNLLLGLALIALAACGKVDGSEIGGVLFPLLASALALLSALLIAKVPLGAKSPELTPW